MKTDIAKKRIILIGGAGFIGHNLALKLAAFGADVSIIDGLQVNNFLSYLNYTGANGNQDLYMKILNERLRLLREADVDLIIQDCRDYNGLQRNIENIEPDVVVHLAAIAHANKSNRDPFSTFDHSFRTLENSLDCARDIQPHFIYLSSSMVYGNFESGYVTEETHCEPIGIYGALKFGGEKLVIAYNQVFDLPYTIIRPSALYGERCVSRRVGQIFIENALQGIDITIKGNGDARLDFTYIDDLVHGIIRVIENENARNEVFNLTYGESRSLKDMLEILKEFVPSIKAKYLPQDKLTPSRGTLSVDKAKKLINYSPKFPLEKGFAKYYKWYETLFNENKELKGKLNLLH